MGKLSRWIRQRRLAACQKHGHLYELETRSLYVMPSESWRAAVADYVVEERIACRRCGSVDMDWREASRSSIQSLRMDAERMNELESMGRLVIR